MEFQSWIVTDGLKGSQNTGAMLRGHSLCRAQHGGHPSTWPACWIGAVHKISACNIIMNKCWNPLLYTRERQKEEKNYAGSK